MKSVRNPIDVAFGAGLRAQRQAARLSLEELGRRIGVTYQQVQKYESGANRVSISTAAEIAEALEIHIDELMASVASIKGGQRAPKASSLRLAVQIDGLLDEQREKIAGLVAVVADANARSVRAPLSAEQPAPLAH